MHVHALCTAAAAAGMAMQHCAAAVAAANDWAAHPHAGAAAQCAARPWKDVLQPSTQPAQQALQRAEAEGGGGGRGAAT